MRNFWKEDERLEMVLRTTTVTKKKFEVVEFEKKKKKKKKKTLHNVYCWVIDSFWAEIQATEKNERIKENVASTLNLPWICEWPSLHW